MADEYVFTADEPGKHLYIIHIGRVEVITPEGVVVTVEVFGDDQPFHRRAAKAEMHPGVQFGWSREAVLAALGARRCAPRPFARAGLAIPTRSAYLDPWPGTACAL